MNMKTKSLIGFIALAIMLSGCGTPNNEANGDTPNAPSTPSTPSANESQLPANEDKAEPTMEPAASSDDIHIVIDQTEKPIEGDRNSFDFSVQKRPDGYALTSMEWSSANLSVVNSLQEAIEHGANGENGFYISGNGQFMGFFYDKALAGETGKVSFTFTDEQGNELIWSKEVTLL